MPVDIYYPEGMFSAPGMVADVLADGTTIARTVPTEDPNEVRWQMVHAIALNPD
jgi:hypothetical protein